MEALFALTPPSQVRLVPPGTGAQNQPEPGELNDVDSHAAVIYGSFLNILPENKDPILNVVLFMALSRAPCTWRMFRAVCYANTEQLKMFLLKGW